MTEEALREAFRQRYHAEPRLFSAPARVNIMGEHTDYNDGFVLPTAIQFRTWVAAAVRDDRKITVLSTRHREPATLDLDAPAPGRKSWSAYVFGVALALEQNGKRLKGANLLIDGDVPVQAGLSSSASVEVAVGLALLAVAGQRLDPAKLARVCQQAENKFVGMRCGIMDQFVVAHGLTGQAMLLDCRSMEYRLVPLLPEARLVMCNSGVHRQLVNSEYNLRRQQCEAGVSVLKGHRPALRALRDATVSDLQQYGVEMPEVVFRRCRHVVSENARVLEAAEALVKHDAAALGKLMWASHRSLQHDYEVSCVELDLLVEIAMSVKGVWGARMMGAGFGGCTLNLVAADAVESFRDLVIREYRDQTGRTVDVYVSSVTPAPAASS